MVEIERVKTHVKGLDKHIENGIPKGSISLICGTPGTMKSSLAYSILYNNALKSGLKGVYVTLEQDTKSLKQQMKALNMDKDVSVDFIEFEDVRKKSAKDKSSIKIMEKLISDMKGNYDLLVLDSLNAMYSLALIENPRREIYEFFKSLHSSGMTSFLVSEMSLDKESFSDYGVEGFLADGIIHLDFKKRGDILKSLERYIGIVKMRTTNHDTQYFPVLYMGDSFTVYGREDLELK
ncbi:MAG: RAD55 family ATPase [Candidatus Hydrothermarchaeaceae archaeon]